MKHRLIAVALAAVAVSPAAVLANDDELAAESRPKSKQEIRKAEEARKKEIAAMSRPVDINSASPAELKKLPRIGDAEALAIIAGRPYGSAAWLVTKRVLPEGLYMDIKDRIIARQPFKDGDKNAEIYKKQQ